VEGARSGLASGERLQELSRRPQPVPDPVAPLPAPAGHTVEVSGVSLRYAPDGLPALDSVSVRLSRGRRIGIVGASGSGKSTLASLLMRFREFEGGTFTIDGIDVRSLDAADVRRHIGLVAQDAHVFATSVRENLRLARPGATDDELRDALRRAQLLGWVDSLPAGWDTRVGEHGARISGGQRRRLCIARALLARFPVLIVDEPTEALDASTAAALMAALLEATRDSALLVISHRAADMRGMDEVLTMRDGRVTRLDERG